MKKKIAVIGSGISGLSAAAYAAKAGYDVYVFEKNSTPGGRARQFHTEEGYLFDMGPSWYWLPDIINEFFQDFGHQSSDFYDLVSLNPQFDMVFSDGRVSIPKEYEQLRNLFESIEPGAGKELDKFMEFAKYKYEAGIKKFIYKPSHSLSEFISFDILPSIFKLNLFSNFHGYVRRFFSNPKLIALMEFPVIFLGATPKNIPALYSLMNYGGYVLGTWYPMGGFYKLITSMKAVGELQGVKYYFNHSVEKINVENGLVQSLIVNGEKMDFDAVIASSDYHHTETLLDHKYRNYEEEYWESRKMAPSCLIYYLGFKEVIPNLKHHTLFFENDLDKHNKDIYEDKKWPEKPLFYACCPSKTDPLVAPANHENVFLLMPIAPGISDNEDIREHYFTEMISRIERLTGTTDLVSKIDYKKSYCVSDFINDYNAYKGNAYGLANTLSQTAIFKPSLKNKKVKNLFYAGQLTVPGPGVPPSIISGKIAATEIDKL